MSIKDIEKQPHGHRGPLNWKPKSSNFKSQLKAHCWSLRHKFKAQAQGAGSKLKTQGSKLKLKDQGKGQNWNLKHKVETEGSESSRLKAQDSKLKTQV